MFRAGRKDDMSLLHFSNTQIGLSALALAAGIGAALVITLFRYAIEWPLVEFLPMTSEEDYESLGEWARLILLLAGGLTLILIFQPLDSEKRAVGVAHVLKRMEMHQGHMPLGNLIRQWFAAAIALLSGHSVGREGPAIHLGAGTASQLGQLVGIAHHHHRIIAGAGVASAISASFNTPMAGVIFAMEVVLLEYSIRGFIPIILASVAGAVVSRLIFGDAPAFDVPPLAMGSLWELPYIVLLGLVAGLMSAAFILLLRQFQRLNRLSLWLKWGGLTAATAVISIWLPAVLGIGYDTVNLALAGEVAIASFLMILAAKLLLASWAAAVAFPAGLIGPTLFIGACVGGLMGMLSQILLPEYQIEVGFFTMLGMGALMGAVLRAPLAALVTLLELTANPNIILPAMLAIVTASLVVSELFKLPSVFIAQLGNNHNDTPDPVHQMLRSSWVARVMDRRIAITPERLSFASAQQLVADKPEWLYIESKALMIPTAALAAEVQQRLTRQERPTADPASGMTMDEDAFSSEIANQTPLPEADIPLLDIPGERQSVGQISLRANLQEALDHMQDQGIQWLAVYERPLDSKRGAGDCIGLVSEDMIERYYRYRPQSA